MVQSRKVELKVKIEVNIPLDIINDKGRLREPLRKKRRYLIEMVTN
jgi:hypothetical protein